MASFWKRKWDQLRNIGGKVADIIAPLDPVTAGILKYIDTGSGTDAFTTTALGSLAFGDSPVGSFFSDIGLIGDAGLVGDFATKGNAGESFLYKALSGTGMKSSVVNDLIKSATGIDAAGGSGGSGGTTGLMDLITTYYMNKKQQDDMIKYAEAGNKAQLDYMNRAIEIQNQQFNTALETKQKMYDKSYDLQLKQYEQNRNDLKPWLNAGKGAIDVITKSLNIGYNLDDPRFDPWTFDSTWGIGQPAKDIGAGQLAMPSYSAGDIGEFDSPTLETDGSWSTSDLDNISDETEYPTTIEDEKPSIDDLTLGNIDQYDDDELDSIGDGLSEGKYLPPLGNTPETFMVYYGDNNQYEIPSDQISISIGDKGVPVYTLPDGTVLGVGGGPNQVYLYAPEGAWMPEEIIEAEKMGAMADYVDSEGLPHRVPISSLKKIKEEGKAEGYILPDGTTLWRSETPVNKPDGSVSAPGTPDIYLKTGYPEEGDRPLGNAAVEDLYPGDPINQNNPNWREENNIPNDTQIYGYADQPSTSTDVSQGDYEGFLNSFNQANPQPQMSDFMPGGFTDITQLEQKYISEGVAPNQAFIRARDEATAAQQEFNQANQQWINLRDDMWNEHQGPITTSRTGNTMISPTIGASAAPDDANALVSPTSNVKDSPNIRTGGTLMPTDSDMTQSSNLKAPSFGPVDDTYAPMSVRSGSKTDEYVQELATDSNVTEGLNNTITLLNELRNSDTASIEELEAAINAFEQEKSKLESTTGQNAETLLNQNNPNTTENVQMNGTAQQSLNRTANTQSSDQQNDITQDQRNAMAGTVDRRILPFEEKQFETSPGYDFRQTQGQKGLESSASARGGLLSGKAVKDAMDFNQNLASNEYGNWFQQERQRKADWGRDRSALITEIMAQKSIADQDRKDAINEKLATLEPYFRLAGMGASTGGTLGSQGNQAVNAMASLSSGYGNSAANMMTNYGSNIGNQFNKMGSTTSDLYTDMASAKNKGNQTLSQLLNQIDYRNIF